MLRPYSNAVGLVRYIKTPLVKAVSTNQTNDFTAAKPYESLPGVKSPLQMLRAAAQFLPFIGKHRNSPLRIQDWHTEALALYGKIYCVKVLAGPTFVLVSDPAEIRKAIKHDGKNPQRRMLDVIKIYRNNNKDLYPTAGILVDNGEDWANTRFKVQAPVLNPNLVDKYINKMEKVSEDFVSHMKKLRDKKGEVPEYLNEIYKWALESIGLITLNSRLGCLEKNLKGDSEPQQMITAINELFEIANATEFGPKFWLWFPTWTKSYKRLEIISNFIYTVVTNHIEATRDRLKLKLVDDKDKGILETILQQKLDIRDITTFMMDLLAAGVDTTSHSLGAILYLLAKNPDTQEKLYSEILSALKSCDGKLNRKTLDGMNYLKGSIKESMRLMPVVEGTQRYFDHDIVLGGYRIPAGIYVVLLAGVAARSAEYFDEPEKFKPERWFPNAKKPDQYAYLPFGFGPRSCIGRRIALQELELLLIQILKNFKVEYHYEDIRMKTRFVSMPDKPLRFTFIDRN